MKNFLDYAGTTIGNVLTGILALVSMGILIIALAIVVLLGLVWTIMREIFTLGCVGFEVCEYFEQLEDTYKEIRGLD